MGFLQQNQKQDKNKGANSQLHGQVDTLFVLEQKSKLGAFFRLIKKGEKMREIKFRGKRLRDGKWVYGFFRIDDYNLIIAIDGNFIVEYKVNPETVGQFTGLNTTKTVKRYLRAI